MKVTNHGSGPKPILAYALLMLLKQPERYAPTALSFRGHTSEGPCHRHQYCEKERDLCAMFPTAPASYTSEFADNIASL